MIWSVLFDGQPTEELSMILARSGCKYGMIANKDNQVVGLRIQTKTEELRLGLGQTLTWNSETGVMAVENGARPLL